MFAFVFIYRMKQELNTLKTVLFQIETENHNFDKFHVLVLQSARERSSSIIPKLPKPSRLLTTNTVRFRYIVSFHRSGENKVRFVKFVT